MMKEEILKLLAALGIKISVDGADGTMKEDDAIKLVEDQFKASNLGLIQNRDALLAENKTFKEKIATMETTATESNKKIGEIDAQLKKNSPEENKKYYEAQLQEAKTKFEQDIAGITADRDKYRESHFTRVRNDEINEAVKDIQFIDGLKDGFISLAMTRNQFQPIEVDNKTIFVNQDKKAIGAVLHELSLSKEGKAYIKNGNQGSGAHGVDNRAGTGQGGKTMTRNDFMVLSPKDQMDFTDKGGTITD